MPNMLINYTGGKDGGEGSYGGIIPNIIKSITGNGNEASMSDEVKRFFDTLEIGAHGSFVSIAEDANIADKSFKRFLKTTKNTGTVYKESKDAMNAYNASLEAINATTKTASLGTKALSMSMKVLSSIGWTIAIAIGTKVIAGIGEAIYDATHAAEKLSKEVNEAIDDFNSSMDKVKSRQNIINDYGQRFDELSRGVNKLGQNVSLTVDEYAEYQDITSEIAEAFPEIVTGWTEQGVAIINLKNGVEDLTQAYKDEKAAANEALIFGTDSNVTGDDIIKDWENNIYKDVGNGKSQVQAIKELEDFISSDITADRLNEIISLANQGIYDGMSDIEKEISSSEFLIEKLGLDKDITPDMMQSIKRQAKVLAQTYNTELNSNFDSMRSLMGAYLSTNEDYKAMDEESQAITSMLVNGIEPTSDTAVLLATYSKEQIGQYVQFMIDALNDSNPEVKEALINLYALDTTEMPVAESERLIDSYISTIAEYLHRDKNELSIALGFDLSQRRKDAGVAKNMLRKNIGINGVNSASDAKMMNDINDWIDSLSEDDLQLLIKMGFDDDTKIKTKQDLLDYIESLKDIASKNEIKLDVTVPLNQTKTDFSDLDDIYTQIISGDTVDADSIAKLDEAFGELEGGKALEDFKKTLTTMPGDIKAGKDALNKLATAYVNNSKLLDNLDESTKQYTIDQLKEIGVTNAKEVVESRLNEETKQYIKNLEAFTTVLNKNLTVLEEGRVNSVEYSNAVNSITAALNNLLGTEEVDFSNKFISDNLPDMKAAIDGDTDALNRLRVAASKEIIAHLGVEGDVQAEINALLDSVNIPDLVADAHLNTNPFITALNDLVQKGAITRDNMNKILSGIGITPKVTTKKIKITTPDLSFGLPKTYRGIGDDVLKPHEQYINMPVFSYEATGGAAPIKVGYGGSGGGKSGSGSGGGSGSDSSNQPEVFDWIEVKLKRIQEELDRLKKTEENVFFQWTKRGNALNDELDKIPDKIKAAQDGYKRYMKAAQDVGLSAEYQQKVIEGKISLETIRDDALKEKIKTFQEWLEKAIALKDSIVDLRKELAELQLQKFNNYVKQFEEYQGTLTDAEDIISAQMDNAKARGRLVTKQYYDTQMIQEKQRNDSLLKQRTAMINAFNKMVANGTVAYHSEQWYELNQQINDITKEIIESDTKLVEFANDIRQIEWDLFDTGIDKLATLNDELEFMNNLLSANELTDGEAVDNKGLTKYGDATMGNYAARYENLTKQAAEYKKEIADIDAELAKNNVLVDGKIDTQHAISAENQDLIDRRKELVNSYQDSIIGAKEERDAMIELSKSGYQALLDKLNELIEKRKELLQDEKDAYEYSKNIADKTENLAKLQKQLSVYQNSDDEEYIQKVQKLKASIKDAEESLAETEYDHWISETENMLDDLSQDFSDFIDEKFENLDDVFAELRNDVNSNMTEINDTLMEISSKVGYNMSEELKDVWDMDTTNGILEDFSSSVKNVLAKILESVETMKTNAEKEAEKIISKGNQDLGQAENTQKEEAAKKKQQEEEKTKYGGVLEDVKTQFDESNGIKYQQASSKAKTTLKPLSSLTTTSGLTVTQSQMNQLSSIVDSASSVATLASSITKLPTTSRTSSVQINMGDIVLPNVNDPYDFADNFISALQNDNRVQQAINAGTIDILAGANSKRINNY